ncbi:ABC-type glycerol-3-phosphate transport system substrate-binding protein [Paenibacillus rhizosphaerae]|uniref:ABC-type glycerol-3-phosphate transport system substrate-binding protein n=1 Tax=Paenibacillus rhizosphaerae TaxID=297318 RepID=A0A839U0T1_9BACL|nr:extracellular solute-binding protein [Paenibacillus rhizosphaerae]MBB3131248.1 ABC-type glycerol-3-phosphate transport system substrate-binding protein [Paenibacillus rhizosphaerae]
MFGKKAGAVTAALLTAVALTACSGGNGNNPAPTATESGGPTKELPKIYIYQNTGALNQKPEGSVPEKLEEMKQHYMDTLGIEPIAIVPPTGSAEEKLNLMLGSSDEVDTFQGNWDDYASKGAIIPLNDLLDQYGQDIKKAWPEEAWEYMTDKDGKIWGIPRGEPSVHYPIWVRSDWLKKLNLEMPQNLEELEAVMKAFKEQDPDGNGKDDTIPMMTDLNGIKNALMGGFLQDGNSNWIDPADNKLKPAELAPGFKDFMATMADWYQKGYIYKESFSKFDPLELLKTNRVGMSSMWYSRITLLFPQIKPSLPEGAEYEIIRGIEGPKGKLMTASPGSTASMVITKKAKHPDAVMKFINHQYQDIPTNSLTAAFGKDWRYTGDNKFDIELTTPDITYAGEYMVSLGTATELKYAFNDPVKKMHADYLTKEALNLEVAKMPIDSTIIYDKDALAENIPTNSDIDRLRSEELVKFVTGARPISEFDGYIEQLYQAGLDQWIEEYTRQYNEKKK